MSGHLWLTEGATAILGPQSSNWLPLEIIVRKLGQFYAQSAESTPPRQVEKVGVLDWGLERDHRIVYFFLGHTLALIACRTALHGDAWGIGSNAFTESYAFALGVDNFKCWRRRLGHRLKSMYI